MKTFSSSMVAGSAILMMMLPVSIAFMNGRPSLIQIPKQHPSTIKPLFSSSSSSSSSSEEEQEPIQRAMLVGPSLLQLVIARHLDEAGIEPFIVLPTKKVESFRNLLTPQAENLLDTTQIGLPEESDPPGTGWREGIDSIIFCAEESAGLTSTALYACLNWDGYGNDKERDPGGPKRAIFVAPTKNKVNKEKSLGWAPISALFNSDEKQSKAWESLEAYWDRDRTAERVGTTLRVGSLFGGGQDGPEELEDFGLDEGIYKMSLEQYRDLRERGFDRYKLGAQIIEGDTINLKPPGQEDLEKKTLRKDEELEAFKILDGYPEIDRTCRHVAAAAIVECLQRPVSSLPREFTVLSKADKKLPTKEEWDTLFAKPSAGNWPDPATFVMPKPTGAPPPS